MIQLNSMGTTRTASAHARAKVDAIQNRLRDASNANSNANIGISSEDALVFEVTPITKANDRFHQLHRLVTSLSARYLTNSDVTSLVTSPSANANGSANGVTPWDSPWLFLLSGERLIQLPRIIGDGPEARASNMPVLLNADMQAIDDTITYLSNPEHVKVLNEHFKQMAILREQIAETIDASVAPLLDGMPPCIRHVLHMDRAQLVNLTLAGLVAPLIEAADPVGLATTAAPALFDRQYTIGDVPQGILDLQGSTDFRAYAQYKGAFVKGQIGGRPMLRLFLDLI